MSFMNSLKTNWQATDFYNFEDLNRVDLATRYLNERIFDYKGERLVLDLPPNLMPFPSDPARFTMWNNNGTLTAKSFSSGRQGFRAEMTDFVANPNLRVVNSATLEASTSITKGEGYIFTVIFKASPDLVIADFLGIYYHTNVTTPYWTDFASISLADCPVESERDNTYRLDIHFIAQDTARVSGSFGFGLTNNPAIKNGSWFDIVEFRIQAARTEKTIEFASGFNRIESNIAVLRNYLSNATGIDEPKTNWASQAFTYIDANRLENNLYRLHKHFITNATNVPYTGMYTVGQQGVY